MITKLYEKKYGCQPPESPRQVASGSAPGAPSNLLSSAKPKDDESADDYDDDFDDVPEIGTDKVKGGDLNLKSKPLGSNLDGIGVGLPSSGHHGAGGDQKKTGSAVKDVDEFGGEDEDDDDWGMDEDDWGDKHLEDNDDRHNNNSKKPSLLGIDGKNSHLNKNDSSPADKKKQKNNLFLGGIGGGKSNEPDDVGDLDDIDNFLGNGGGNEDKFNQVLSKTKEGGGLLASIGLNKDDVKDGQSLGDDSELNDSQNHHDLHKKSDLFDTSKDRKLHARGGLDAHGISEDDEDFDLGFASNSKKGDDPQHKQSENENLEAFEAELAAAQISDDDGPMTTEQ